MSPSYSKKFVQVLGSVGDDLSRVESPVEPNTPIRPPLWGSGSTGTKSPSHQSGSPPDQHLD